MFGEECACIGHEVQGLGLANPSLEERCLHSSSQVSPRLQRRFPSFPASAPFGEVRLGWRKGVAGGMDLWGCIIILVPFLSHCLLSGWPGSEHLSFTTTFCHLDVLLRHMEPNNHACAEPSATKGPVFLPQDVLSAAGHITVESCYRTKTPFSSTSSSLHLLAAVLYPTA